MTFFWSLILSLAIIIILSLVFQEEARFWLGKISKRFRKKKPEIKEINERLAPIKKCCDFRDWSESGGEICTLFEEEDGREYKVTEDLCRQCQVPDRYEAWLASGKKEDLSVTLLPTFQGSHPMVVESDKLNPEAEKDYRFNEFVIKRRRMPWAGKGAIAFLTLATYLIVYFSGIFTNPVVRADAIVYYYNIDGDYAVAGSWNMRTSKPSKDDDITKCTETTGVFGSYCHLKPGVDNSTYESVYAGPKKLGWMTDNNSLISGTFVSGDWKAKITYTWYTNGECSYVSNYIESKLWRGSSDLSSTTVINDWTKTCDLTVGEHTCDPNFDPGEVSLSNEVLHLEFRQYLEADSCGRDPADILSFKVTTTGDYSGLGTTNFSAVPENSVYFAIAVPFIPLIIKRFKLRDYFNKVKAHLS